MRIRKIFKFENPTPVHTPATIDPTEIYQRFFRYDHTNSRYCRNWKNDPGSGPFFSQIFDSGSGSER